MSLKEKYNSLKPNQLRLVLIKLQEDEESIKTYIARNKFNYTLNLKLINQYKIIKERINYVTILLNK